MTTSFDSAISHLTNRMNSRGEGSEREELRQAIRVLEAAGKVDKEDSLWALPAINDSKVYNNLRDLLEILPDKEEK